MPLLFLALECAPDAPDNEPELSRSLSLSLVPLPCSARSLNLFMCCVPAPVTGATGALLALLLLVANVSYVVLGAPGSANERRMGACCPCEAGVGFPLGPCGDGICVGVAAPLPLGGNSPWCYGGMC